jgi:Icc-related predicted phosphoesterase
MMTTFKVMSDLHLEFQDGREYEFLIPYDEEDVLILAGDVQTGMNLDWWIADLLKYRDVYYLMGNHEYYHHDLNHPSFEFTEFEGWVNAVAKESLYKHSLYCLQNNMALREGVIILGATLWTDFNDSIEAAIAAKRCMNDYVQISCDDQELQPSMILDEHKESLVFLKSHIEQKQEDQKLVVITHHSPSYRSMENQYRGDLLNAAYANKLDALVEKTTLWVHGHTHHSFDYRIGEGRVVCNPRGYYPRHLNKDFNPHLVVTV